MNAREKSFLAALWFLICWYVLPWVVLFLTGLVWWLA